MVCRTVVIWILAVLPVIGSAAPHQSGDGGGSDELFEKARAAWRDAETAQALQLFSEAADRLVGQENWSKAVKSLLYKSSTHLDIGDPEGGSRSLDRATDLFKQNFSDDHRLGVCIDLQRAQIEKHHGELEPALRLSRRAVEKAGEMNSEPFKVLRAEALHGTVLLEMGSYRRAVRAFEKARNRIGRIPSDERKAYAKTLFFGQAGMAYWKTGDIDRALSFFAKQKKYLDRIYRRDHPLIAKNHNRIGQLYLSAGDVVIAAHHFLRSSELLERNYGRTHPLVAEALNNAGEAFVELEMLDVAQLMLDEALEIKQSTLGTRHIKTASTYLNLGKLSLQRERYEAALDYYDQALQIRSNRTEEEHPEQIPVYLERGRLYLIWNQPEKALHDFRQALQIGQVRLGEFHPEAGRIYRLIGEAKHEMDLNRAALRSYQLAISSVVAGFQAENSYVNPSALTTDHPRILLKAFASKADFLRKRSLSGESMELLHASYDTYLKAIKLIDGVQVNVQHERSRLVLLEQNHGIFEGALELSGKLFRKSGDEGYLRQAYRIIEKSKTQLAQELMLDDADHDVDSLSGEVMHRDRKIRRDIASLHHQFLLEGEREESYSTDRALRLQERLLDRHAYWMDWIRQLKKDHPEFYRSRYRQSLSKLDGIRREELPSNRMVLNYFVGNDHLYLLLLSREEMQLHQLGESDGLSHLMESLFCSLERKNPVGFAESASALYHKVLGPVEEQLSGYDELLIIPDHELHDLPFELLLTDRPETPEPWNWSYLIQSHLISYAPSLEVYLQTQNNQVSQHSGLLAVAPWGNPSVRPNAGLHLESLAGELSPLPLSRYETEEVASLYRESGNWFDRLLNRPTPVDLLFDGQASVTGLLDRDLSRYRYIHFATHAFIHDTFPSLSGILFSEKEEESGVIHLNDIYDLELAAELVVLSACETGRGSLARGEGVIGFTRAFLSSGTRNLMVSMWKVSDRTSATLMTRFYQELFRGAKIGEALRRAKLSMIRSSETAFPADWASFILIGE